MSVFEEQPLKNPVPAPGAYNVDHSAVLDAKGASMFGKSSVPRFAIDARALEMEPVFSEEELVLAAGGAAGTTARSTTRPQTRQYPRVPVSSKPGTAFAPPPVLGKFGSKPGTSSSTTEGAFTHPVTVVLGCHPKVVVKPLTLGPTPPSIPSPLVSFGFAEDAATGRLVARNLKMKKVTPLKSPLGMSVRRAQTADHHHSESCTTNSKNILPGPTFSKHAGHDLDQFLIMPTGGKGGNLVSKPRRPQDGTLAAHMTALQLEQEKNPAPNSYDISAGEKWISTHGPSVKSYRMGDVALPRFAELAEKQTVKNGIPGPAVYTATNPIDDFLCRITDGKVNTNCRAWWSRWRKCLCPVAV